MVNMVLKKQTLNIPKYYSQKKHFVCLDMLNGIQILKNSSCTITQFILYINSSIYCRSRIRNSQEGCVPWNQKHLHFLSACVSFQQMPRTISLLIFIKKGTLFLNTYIFPFAKTNAYNFLKVQNLTSFYWSV